jgi:tetratricopeptide (TPR) repeat protein
MGLPWWDYWFPVSLMLRGYNLQSLTRPGVLHLQHDQQVNAKTPTWRILAREYGRATLRDSGIRRLAGEEWRQLLDLCRALDRADDARFEAGEFDQQIIDLSTNTVPLIAGNMTQRAKGSLIPHSFAVPAGTFDNLAGRAAAGTALVRGLWDEKHGNLPRAEWQFERCAQMAPHDAAALFECGNFFFRHGKMERAASVLTRAVECMPDSALLLNSLGSALGHLSRNDEAAAYFERAIDADPLYGGSYYNLAVVLWLKNRHMEVVSRLEQRLAQTPDFPEGAEWLRRIRETLTRFGREAAQGQVNR